MGFGWYFVGGILPITLKARDVMDKNVLFIESDRIVSDAIDMMVRNNVWSLVVLDKGVPVGVITERDIFRRVLGKGLKPESVKVKAAMTSPIITIEPDAPLGEAIRLMVEKEVRRIYVVEDGKIVGRITEADLFQNLLNVMLAIQSITYQF